MAQTSKRKNQSTIIARVWATLSTFSVEVHTGIDQTNHQRKLAIGSRPLSTPDSSARKPEPST